MEKYSILLLLMVMGMLVIFPSTGSLNKIPQGGDIFIGEKDLDISAAVGNSPQIAWWEPGTSMDGQPAATERISDPMNFYVNPDQFVDLTGTWFTWDGGEAGPAAFTIREPSMNIKIWDSTFGKDMTGKKIPLGNYANFIIETNMMSIAARPGYSPGDGPFKIKVRTSEGGVLQQLIGTYGRQLSLAHLTVDQPRWYWIGDGDDHSGYARNDGWNTAAEDENNEPLYQEGVYSVWAECNANGIKDQYLSPDGSDYTGKTVSAEKSMTLISGDIISLEANKKTVTPGSPFLVTITGVPHAEYLLWVKGTGSMTGQPGDQPPMIIHAQDGAIQDDPAGPYEVGKYQYEGGAGKSVKQDVPDDPDYHGTKYYAMVKLDAEGTRTVEFRTNKAKKYTIRVERRSGSQYLSDEVVVRVGAEVQANTTATTNVTSKKVKTSG